jgi:hypothetical protein
VTAEASRHRAEALAQGLRAVEARIASACAASGRRRDDVTLVVVTKTFPASDVRLLAGLGVADVGESRDQEAVPKVAECAGLPMRWHFVGRLQTNKAVSVARYAHWVHSVDRARLVPALARGAATGGRRLGCLVQVSLDLDAAQRARRGGAAPDDVPGLADSVVAAEGLDLVGVMAVAPLGADPVAAFERLAAVAERVRSDHPGAVAVSAGMSADLEAAVAWGATHLRVGSAVLGSRPVLQ